MKNFDEKMDGIHEKAQEAKEAIFNPSYTNDMIYQLRWLSYRMQEAIANGRDIKDVAKCNKALDSIQQIDEIISQHVENSKKYMWLIDMAVKGFEEAVKDC